MLNLKIGKFFWINNLLLSWIYDNPDNDISLRYQISQKIQIGIWIILFR